MGNETRRAIAGHCFLSSVALRRISSWMFDRTMGAGGGSESSRFAFLPISVEKYEGRSWGTLKKSAKKNDSSMIFLVSGVMGIGVGSGGDIAPMRGCLIDIATEIQITEPAMKAAAKSNVCE